MAEGENLSKVLPSLPSWEQNDQVHKIVSVPRQQPGGLTEAGKQEKGLTEAAANICAKGLT